MLSPVLLARARALAAFCLVFLAAAAAPLVAQTGVVEPVGLFLTWQRDPTTTMTVDWHTAGEAALPALHYRELGGREWKTVRVAGEYFGALGRTLHRAELTRLRPATTYEFHFGPGSRTFRFRTLPARLERPLRFVAGGDLRHSQEWMEESGRVALRYDPEFVLAGGDLAYADEKTELATRYREFFDAYRNSLIDRDGRVVPMLVVQGNHETIGGYHFNYAAYAGDDRSRELISPYFYRLFASPGQPGYRVVDFGDYLSVLLLNSDHSTPVAGEQTRWLARVLEERRGVPHLFPIYHVPAYPSVRAFESRVSAQVREHWVPLFERNGVRVAFENHDHAYKRTHPLRDGKVSPDGIVYLGDGAWGVEARPIRQVEGQRPWYLAAGEPVRHIILVTLDGDSQHFQAVSHDGRVFDEVRVRVAR